jgi:hypothetical protein
MARHVGISVVGGWYHVFTRGHNRVGIFGWGDKDYGHFLELVERMRELYRLRVHACCLMSTAQKPGA